MQCSSLRHKSLRRICAWGGMPIRSEICLSTPKLDTTSPWKVSKMGRGTNHGYPLLARPELVPWDSEAGTRTTKEVLVLRIAPIECSHRGSNLQGHDGYQNDCLEALSKACSRMELQKRLQGKSETCGLMVPERITSKCLNIGVLSIIRKGLPTLQVYECTGGIPSFPPHQPWLPL